MVCKTIWVCSVKGGTGKTVVSVNLAKELSKYGRVGLIDADIDSSNFVEFTHVKGKLNVVAEGNKRKFELFDWEGIKVFSMGLFEEQDRPVCMIGESYGQIICDVINESDWGQLDYMVVDLPAGANDIFKAITNEFKGALGGIVVTQPAAVVDAKRVVKLHRRNGLPVIGLIENMSGFVCEHGAKYDVFGESTVETLGKEFGVPVLGCIPLSMDIRKAVVNGTPWLSGDASVPVLKACKIVVESPQPELEKKTLSQKVEDLAQGVVERVLAHVIKLANVGVDIKGRMTSHGFTGGNVIDIVVVNDEFNKVLSRTHFTVRKDKLVVLRSPSHVDFEVWASVKTFSRLVLGKARVGDNVVGYDPVDAWTNGDVRVYGRGSTPWVLELMRTLFGNAQERTELGSKFSVLEKFI